MLQLLRESFKYPNLSEARYTFIQLNELGQCGVNEIAQVSKRQLEDLNTDSLD